MPLGDLEAVKAAIGPETAAIMIEPIQGEGGIREVSGQFLRDLRALCDEGGLMLIFDEVQTGIGRTGRLFAYEWAGAAPDIMTAAFMRALLVMASIRQRAISARVSNAVCACW